MLSTVLVTLALIQAGCAWRYSRNKGILPNPYTYSGLEFVATPSDTADSGTTGGHTRTMSLSAGPVDIFGTTLSSVECSDVGVCYESTADGPDTSEIVIAPNWLPAESSLYDYTFYMQRVARTSTGNPGPNSHYLDFTEEIVHRTTYPQSGSTAWSCDQVVVVTWRIMNKVHLAEKDVFQVVFAHGTKGTIDTDFVLMLYDEMSIGVLNPQRPRGYINIAHTAGYSAPCGGSATNPSTDMDTQSNYYCAAGGHFVFQTSGSDGLASTRLSSMCGADTANLALGKTVTQSSTSVTTPGPADLAIDGDLTTGTASCTHTDETSTAGSEWWQVDIGAIYTFTTIRVLNAGTLGSRLQNIDIFVGTVDGFKLCYQYDGPGEDGVFYTFTCRQPVSGRYVRIVMQEQGVLTLCEVQVFGEVNLALGESATQLSDSAISSTAGPASLAVDGTADSLFEQGFCSNTDEFDTVNSQWWQVELASTYTITTVRILNPTNSLGQRLVNVDIYVGRSTTSLSLCYYFEGPGQDGVFYTFTCNQPIPGRLVRIRKRNPGPLTLCEVEVYGIANLALDKAATQSSNGAGNSALAYLAVDGLYNAACTLTSATNNPWWQVDLQVQYWVSQVRVLNRPTGNTVDQLTDIDVLVGDDVNTFQLCHHFAGPGSDGELYTFTCTEPVMGRYVRIARNKAGRLALCEVEVYQEGGGSPITNYREAYPNRNSVRADSPVGDSCTESVYCEIDQSSTDSVLIHFRLMDYQGDALHFLDYVTHALVDDSDPTCTAPLPTNPAMYETHQTLTFDLFSTIDADEDSRCGMKVNPVAKTVKWRYLVYRDYNMHVGPGVTVNSLYAVERDDLIVYGTCHYADLVHTVGQTNEFGDISVTNVPPRSRSLTLKFVENKNSNLASLTSTQVGADVYVSVCFDPGSLFNANADPYGFYVDDCIMANNQGFLNQLSNANRMTQVINGGCRSKADEDAALYFYKSFEKDIAYDGGSLQFGSPFCVIAGPFSAVMWLINPSGPNTYNMYMRCSLYPCYDTVEYGNSLCHDSCPSDRRRKRSAGDVIDEEVVEGVLEIREPTFTAGNKTTSPSTCYDTTTTVATLASLSAAILLATAYTIVVFIKYQNLRRKLGI